MLIPARNTVTRENKIDHIFQGLRHLDIHKLSEKEIDRLAVHLPEISAITGDILKEEIVKINTNNRNILSQNDI